MREDIIEQMEKAYPDGFLVMYIDGNGASRISGHNMDKSNWLTAFYHLALALGMLTQAQEDKKKYE